jgi:hypothetical protein
MSKPDTPERIKEHSEKYKRGAWRDYSIDELGHWIHLLAKRSTHRTYEANRMKDLEDAQSYLSMIQAHLAHLIKYKEYKDEDE